MDEGEANKADEELLRNVVRILVIQVVSATAVFGLMPDAADVADADVGVTANFVVCCNIVLLSFLPPFRNLQLLVCFEPLFKVALAVLALKPIMV